MAKYSTTRTVSGLGVVLGEYDAAILSAVIELNAATAPEVRRHLGNRPSISGVDTALKRLLRFGFLHTTPRPARKVRGGRRSMAYFAVKAGYKALQTYSSVNVSKSADTSLQLPETVAE